jgi:hypothetical protein
MDEDEIKAMAERLNLPVEDVRRWHVVHGPHYVSATPGRPKGKVKRPKGTLSIGDAIKKYGIDAKTLQDWRDEGMPYRVIGTMVIFKGDDLEKWMIAHGLKKKVAAKPWKFKLDRQVEVV